MYKIIVGSGVCSAEYFFNKMSIAEAHDYVDGIERRHRSDWEQTRLLCRLYFSAKTGEELDMPFPWDAVEEDEASEEELQELRARAKIIEAKLNEEDSRDTR